VQFAYKFKRITERKHKRSIETKIQDENENGSGDVSENASVFNDEEIL
jgi:hypothetical protein